MPEGKRNPDGQIDVYDPERWYRSIAINLTGMFHTVREAARVMKANEKLGERRGGSIICTSSNAAEGYRGDRRPWPYMAAKAGVKHFMRHAALELAAHGIRVNAIAPGPFVTNIGGGWMKRNPAARKAWDKLVPVGAVAEDVANQTTRAAARIRCLELHDRKPRDDRWRNASSARSSHWANRRQIAHN